MFEWWVALDPFSASFILLGVALTVIIPLASINERRYKKSNKPYRYNPEMSMVENGRAQADRDKVLADRKLAKSKRAQELKDMVLPRDIE